MYAELDRLQREMQQAIRPFPSIPRYRAGRLSGAGMRGGTAQSVEVYAFAPGLDPATLDVNLDRGVLTIAGERKAGLPAQDEKTAVHINERFAGRFRRVVTLPDDVDPDGVSATYRDGVLHSASGASNRRSRAASTYSDQETAHERQDFRHEGSLGIRRAKAVMMPPVDVIEDSTGITLYADMPGVPKEKLDVRVEADTLAIEGEISLAVPEGNGGKPRRGQPATLSPRIHAEQGTVTPAACPPS